MQNITYKDRVWFESYNKNVDKKIDFSKKTILDYMDASVKAFPEKTALIFQGYRMTYADLGTMVNRFAAFLSDSGIKKGDSVALLLPNVIPCVVSYFAVLKIGAIAVMNNPLYTDRELEHQFNDSDSKILITLDLLANRMIDLRQKTGITKIVYTSIGDYLPFPKNILFPLVGKKKGLLATVKQAPDVFKWKEVIKKTSSKFVPVTNHLDDVAMYQYTGGTTGISKGVMLTHENIASMHQQIQAWFPEFQEGSGTMLGALPFFHVFGLTTAMNLAICNGWELVLVPKPQPEQLLEAIQKFKPSFAPLVPTMYIGMLSHPDIAKTDMTCIKGCFSGGAPLPKDIVNRFEKITNASISEGFGMTETCAVTHINPFGGQTKIGSIGLPISNTQAKIVDLTTKEKEIPVGEIGELVVKGPQIMKGYKDRPDETAKDLKDGWLYTGDIAKMDEQGFFYIIDRKKDMILSSGYNVYPRDIDEVLFENSKILEACAIGIPHEKRGEAIKVFVVLKENESATEGEIIDYCATKLAKYKLPSEVEFIKELPKTNVGKVLRKDLRAQVQANTKNGVLGLNN